VIAGIVNADLEPIIRLILRGPSMLDQEVEAAIDTGFNGFLTLPAVVLSALRCDRIGVSLITLADGHQEFVDIYEVVVIWEGQPRTVEADTAGGGVLVGTALLEGHELRIQVVDGGPVTIEALP
jgi:clan AA aspartic protease